MRRTTIDLLKAYAKVAVYVVVTYLLILVALAFFSAFHLLDVAFILNVWIAEVPLAFGVYYFLDRRRSSISEAIDRAEVASKYGHLVLHVYRARGVGLWIDYYEVENTSNNLAYDAPNYLIRLVEWDLLRVVRHKDEEAMEEQLKSRGITIKKGQPSPIDLLL